METSRFKKRKKPNLKKGLLLVVLLFVIIFLWFNVDSIITSLFGEK